MSVARGVIGTILVVKEASYGAGGTPSKDVGLVVGGSRGMDSPITESHGYGQATAVSVNPNIVKPRGSYDIELQHGRMLEYAVFGGTTTHALTGGDTTHTFVMANSLPSLATEGSYELGGTDLAGKYIGLLFGSSTISCGLDGLLKMRSDWIAKDADYSGTTATAAVVNTGAPLRGFAASMSLGGSAVDYVQNWELTLNRNSTTIGGQGNRTPTYGASHMLNVAWKATVGFSSTTEIARLMGAASGITAAEPAEFNAQFVADNGITLGSGKRKFDMLMTGCQVKDFTENYALKDFVMYDISGNGKISTTTFVDQITSGNW